MQTCSDLQAGIMDIATMHCTYIANCTLANNVIHTCSVDTHIQARFEYIFVSCFLLFYACSKSQFCTSHYIKTYVLKASCIYDSYVNSSNIMVNIKLFVCQ